MPIVLDFFCFSLLPRLISNVRFSLCTCPSSNRISIFNWLVPCLCLVAHHHALHFISLSLARQDIRVLPTDRIGRSTGFLLVWGRDGTLLNRLGRLIIQVNDCIVPARREQLGRARLSFLPEFGRVSVEGAGARVSNFIVRNKLEQ